MLRYKSDTDAYKRPVFSKVNKLNRLIWKLVWLIFCRYSPVPFHFWRIFILRLFGAEIGANNFIYPSCKIWAPWLLKTEQVATIGPGVEVYNPGGLEIGHHAIVSQDAYLCGATHDYDVADYTFVSKKIVLHPYSWVAARAIVLPGVILEEGSILGAGSITSKNLKPWCIYAGNPAVFIKNRINFVNQNNGS